MALKPNALTTVENVISVIKTYPFLPEGLDFTDADVITEIERLINQWSSTIQTFIRRDVGASTRIEFVSGSTYPYLVLNHYPIREITSIEQIDGVGNVVATLDIESLMKMVSSDDLAKGMLYLEPNFAQRYSSVGIITSNRQNALRGYKVTYEAGYILPKDATEEVPSDIPSDLENLVIDLVKETFIDETDSMRAQDLITLTEGNVQRMWGASQQFTLNKQQLQLVSIYKRKGV